MNCHNFLNQINKRKGSWHQQQFIPTNPAKYTGTNIPYSRSSWELKMMHWLDKNQNVVAWNSENFVVPYSFSLDLKTGNSHKYYCDFYAEIKDRDGNIKKYVIEVKPKSSLIKPEKPKNPTKKAMKNYLYAISTYMKNVNKWAAARNVCESKGLIFKIITEDELNV